MHGMSRHRKRTASTILILAVGLMVACIWAAIKLTHTPAAELGHARLRCQKQDQATHRLVVNASNRTEPVSARECDILILTNPAIMPVTVRFESADGQTVVYDGRADYILPPHQQVSVTLVQSGSFSLVELQHHRVLQNLQITAR